jgi:hypothetical protein
MSDVDYRIEETFFVAGLDESTESEGKFARIYVLEDFPTLGPDEWVFSVDAGNADPDADEMTKGLTRPYIDNFGDALIRTFDLTEKHAQKHELPLAVRFNLCRRPENGYDGEKELRILRALFESASRRRQMPTAE